MPFPQDQTDRAGRGAFVTSQVVLLPFVATLLIAARDNRSTASFRNLDTTGAGGPVAWLGGTIAVSAATGFPISPGVLPSLFGDAVTLATTAPIFGFNGGGLPMTVAIGVVRSQP